MKPGCRRSSAYMSIMNVTAHAPNTVSMHWSIAPRLQPQLRYSGSGDAVTSANYIVKTESTPLRAGSLAGPEPDSGAEAPI
jgi:hypothetical protein